jgi:hypothetical protein
MAIGHRIAILVFALGLVTGGRSESAGLCQGYGPQAPRDITAKAGANPRQFNHAPAYSAMNLCNIHFHTQAEHKGPGFAVSAGKGKHGGYRCNATAKLSKAELAPVAHGACHGLKPGDTLEVHWVHSSCDVKPGPGLGSCLSKACANPQLRVETQVFLVVNDPKALDFSKFLYQGTVRNGLHQAKTLPAGTGKPVVYRGSTTGDKYTQAKCSPLQVTWSVRPNCAKIHIGSIDKWCGRNVFKEDHTHGVRQLVTAPALIAPID